MRLALVVVAVLVAAPAAWAHGEVSPTVIQANKATQLTLHVPTESATASTVKVSVAASPGLHLSGQTTWTGKTRGLVRFTFTARATKAGDYPLHVRQSYSDGKTVDWSGPDSSNTPAPVVQVESPSNQNRDRVLIAIVAGIALVAVFVLRGRRRQSP